MCCCHACGRKLEKGYLCRLVHGRVARVRDLLFNKTKSRRQMFDSLSNDSNLVPPFAPEPSLIFDMLYINCPQCFVTSTYIGNILVR